MPEVAAPLLASTLLRELHLPVPERIPVIDGQAVVVVPVSVPDRRIKEAIRVTAGVSERDYRLLVERLPEVPGVAGTTFSEVKKAKALFLRKSGVFYYVKELSRWGIPDAVSPSGEVAFAGEIDDIAEALARGLIHATDTLGFDRSELSWTSSAFTTLRNRPGGIAAMASFAGLIIAGGLLVWHGFST